MNAAEIIRHINAGANHYIALFAEAEHMERYDAANYSIVRPKAGEEGIHFIYNIHVDTLEPAEQYAVAQEIRASGLPFWLDLMASDDVFALFFGKAKVHGQTAFAFDDEQYLAMYPSQFINQLASQRIIEVRTSEEFAIWAKLANDLLAEGRKDMHPVHHFTLVERGLMRCYVLYSDEQPVSVAATMDNGGVVSLELVATLPEYRRRGYAQAVCAKAIQDAIDAHCTLLTVRANSAASASVYRKLGFQVYNHAL